MFKYSSSWESESNLCSCLCAPGRSWVLVKTLTVLMPTAVTQGNHSECKEEMTVLLLMPGKLLEQYCNRV